MSLARVYAELEAEGVKAFETSYLDLLKALADKAGALAGGHLMPGRQNLLGGRENH